MGGIWDDVFPVGDDKFGISKGVFGIWDSVYLWNLGQGISCCSEVQTKTQDFVRQLIEKEGARKETEEYDSKAQLQKIKTSLI